MVPPEQLPPPQLWLPEQITHAAPAEPHAEVDVPARQTSP
jgi:hypothetical protein